MLDIIPVYLVNKSLDIYNNYFGGYMGNSQIVHVECNTYEKEIVKEKLKQGLGLIGGLGRYVKKGQQVLLKVNLLMGKPPEEAVTTHPAFVEAVAELVAAEGATPIIGDSPGGIFNKGFLTRAYQAAGLDAVAERCGAKLNWDFETEQLPFSEGKILKTVTIGKFVSNADVIINLPKFKTHGLTKLTGAVKNMFGIVPGLVKAEYHMNMSAIPDFADVLLDIALSLPPVLSIMDGITGMQGEGPSGGDPIQLNSVLIGTDPLAVDVAMAMRAGIDPKEVTTIEAAARRGMVSSENEIELLGEPISSASFASPEVRSSAGIDERLPAPLYKLLERLLKPRPVFIDENCIQCGICIQNCPPKVISKTEHGVKADLSGCIRCFCCQELCPERAVHIKRPLLGKLFRGL